MFMRFRLRTLLILMLLGGPLCAWGWKAWTSPEWLRYHEARAAVAARQTELKFAKSLNTGAPRTMAGQRHAELRLRREHADRRQASLLYRTFGPKIP